MFYGDFPSIPLILAITRQNRKTLFCVVLSFRNLPELKLTQDFWSINILPRKAVGDQEVHKRRPIGQMRPGGTGSQPGRAT
jgi:hypothetical protein